jgi:hypothetical protein
MSLRMSYNVLRTLTWPLQIRPTNLGRPTASIPATLRMRLRAMYSEASAASAAGVRLLGGVARRCCFDLRTVRLAPRPSLD